MPGNEVFFCLVLFKYITIIFNLVHVYFRLKSFFPSRISEQYLVHNMYWVIKRSISIQPNVSSLDALFTNRSSGGSPVQKDFTESPQTLELN